MKNTLSFTLILVSVIFITSCGSLSNILTSQVMKADTNNDNIVSWNEWYTRAKNDPESAVSAKNKGLSLEDYARNSFNEFDLNKDNKITRAELDKVMNE